MPSHRPAPSNPAIVVSGGEMLIVKRILLLVWLRLQQISGSNHAFLMALFFFWRVIVNCVSKSVAVRLNICSKLVRNTTFFRIIHWVFLIPKLSQSKSDGPRHCNHEGPTFSYLTIKHCFGPLSHFTKLRHGAFRTPYIVNKAWFTGALQFRIKLSATCVCSDCNIIREIHFKGLYLIIYFVLLVQFAYPSMPKIF